MKRTASISTALLLLLFAAACTSGDSGSEPTAAFVNIGTAPPGGTFYVVGGAIGQVLDQHMGPSVREVTAEATKGSKENIRRIGRGELELALANSAISYFAARGEGEWGTPQPIRAVMTLAPNVALFIAPASGEVREISDLPGRRVYLGPAGAGFDWFVRPLLEAHGVAYDDLVALHGSQTSAVDLLADGNADAAFLGGGVPVASITQASASREIHYVPYDQEAVASLVRDYSFFAEATIPAGTYRGLEADYAGLDVGSMHLITAADSPEELVYAVTRAIYENREEVVARHAAGRAINADNAPRDTGIEFHPGAVRYYREIGIWPGG